jgi:hypothetical protein
MIAEEDKIGRPFDAMRRLDVEETARTDGPDRRQDKG